MLLVAGIAGLTFPACRRAGVPAPVAALARSLGGLFAGGLDPAQPSLDGHPAVSGRPRRWLTGGVACRAGQRRGRGAAQGVGGRAGGGAATMVTPHCGVLTSLASLAVLGAGSQRRREVPAFIFGASVVPVAMLAYLAWHGLLLEAYQDVVVFTASQYASIQGLPYGYAMSLQVLPMALLFPGCVVLAVVIVAAEGRAVMRDRMLWGCAAFALAGFVALFPRPAGPHFGFETPLALPFALAGAGGSLPAGLPRDSASPLVPSWSPACPRCSNSPSWRVRAPAFPPHGRRLDGSHSSVRLATSRASSLPWRRCLPPSACSSTRMRRCCRS